MKKSLITVLLLTLYGCGGGGEIDNSPIPVEPIPVEPKSYSLTGNFEKGPFIIGSEITIQEFDDNLVSTGKTFHTETISNTGNYNMDLSLTEKLVEVSADGYYFNEISGQLSNSKLRLSALANAYGNENININILTHLSKKRIKALVSDGKIFSVAKKQAEEEVQELFNFVAADWEINDFDRMSISEYGDNNSYLLLVSAIIQNINMSTSQLSEYIERLAQDLSDNGVVNENSLIESINLSAQTVNLSIVRTNLTTRYNELGGTVNLPDFELLLNRAPVADAGVDLTGLVGVELTLDGSLSTDIDNDSLTYNWSLIESPEGSLVSLSNENSVSPSLTPDMLGSYSVALTVHDGELSSELDIVVISPENQLPVADVGDNLSIMANEAITLDGSNSFDPDGGELTYLWTSDYSDLTHSEAIWNVGTVSIPDDYTITFTLLVTDPEGLSNESDLVVKFVPDFSDNQDGTISDGLGNMWQKDDSDVRINRGDNGVTYYDPSLYCSGLAIEQYEDWRLPSPEELMLLVDDSVGSPTINTLFFPTTKAELYVTNNWWGNITMGVVDFNLGVISSSVSGFVRCVR
jgi:hypothetical protein